MEFTKDKSIYLQITDIMLDNILNQIWNEGDRIPSVRELAVQVEVNPNTALRAYNELQMKELLENKRGVGFFVAHHAKRKALALKLDEFKENNLPQFIKTAKSLDISPEELVGLIKKYY